jgi:antitoxin ParD1/3/4
MPTRNVVLTDYHEKVIAELVGSGRYQNASEVMREGLRLIEAREARELAKLKALQEASRLGFADLDEGRFRDVAADDLETIIEDVGRKAVANAHGVTRPA